MLVQNPGTLNLFPNDIVSFGVDDTVTARYTANLGYKISTGWEWDLVPLFSNLESQISVLVDSTYLSTLYSLVGTVSCENETQNLGNIYINTTKVEIPLQVIVIDAFRGEDVF